MTVSGSSVDQATARAALPASRKRTLILVVLTLLTSMLLTGWVTQEKEDLLTGRLGAPTQSVLAPTNGRIEQWLVKDGQTVQAENELLRMSDLTRKRKLGEQRQQIAGLEAQLQRRQAQADLDLAWRTRAIEAEILANRLKAAELMQRAYDHQIELHAWNEQLQDGGGTLLVSTSPDDVFQATSFVEALVPDRRSDILKRVASAQNSVEVSQVQIQLCEERMRELQQLKRDLPQKVRRAAGVDETESRLKAARQRLQQLEAQDAFQTVRSPSYGTIRLVARNSQVALSAGEVLAQIIDHEHRHLSVSVPVQYLGRFQVGQTVTVRFADHNPRRGSVAVIGTPSSSNASAVTVIVKPCGRVWPVVPLGTAARIVVPRD